MDLQTLEVKERMNPLSKVVVKGRKTGIGISVLFRRVTGLFLAKTFSICATYKLFTRITVLFRYAMM
ncbi:hypothetical protein ED312_22315 [Sinomicrobium pectinilyticum]|uniref:Uncharacterized protein n=1 Tax=Sinomicrobium pectinilyticum TaxID=1084421 RepID=A0A3N0D0T2_SINP1|nr:hypothetical protein [Sinomicrobium pectinilyticum]RNL69265.1 hypothetical protein ED312_22315 [Sinomicrobium pectinilyticum]